MAPEIVLGLIVLLPLVVLTLLRVNAGLAFFVLCVGSVVTTYVTGSVQDALRGYVAPNSQLTDAVVAVLLLWLPVFIIMFFKMRSIGSRQRFINAVPALCVGLLGALLTVPLLTPEVQLSVLHSSLWGTLKDYQALIVTVGVLSSVFVVRLHAPFEEHHKGKHH